MKLESPVDKILRNFRIKLVIPHIKPDIDICDIGCGGNPVLLNHLSNITTGKLVGLDLLVEDHYDNKIEFRKADIDKSPLPIKSEEFDFISMLAVIEHLNHYNEVISECFRSLKPGGKLLITTPSPISKPILEFFADLGVISKVGVYDHKRYFKKNEILSLLQKHGFNKPKVWSVACGLNIVGLAKKQ